MKKILKRIFASLLAVCVVIFASGAQVYAFSCIYTTCGCKERGLPGCSNSMTCWYGDGDGCSGHSWYFYGEYGASCTSEGRTVYKCSICPGERIYTTPALGHDWGGWTCLNSSQHTRRCNRCGITQNENHSFGGWTANGTGRYKRTCPTCGYSQEKALSIKTNTNGWTAGYSTINITGFDNGSGCNVVYLYRTNLVTGGTSIVRTFNHSGATGSINDAYVETSEGIFNFYAVSYDMGGHTIQTGANNVYIDHSDPVIIGTESTRSDWTNAAPIIQVRATDYLYGYSTNGSGVRSISIYDDYGRLVRNGRDTVTYVLDDQYEGEHTWTIEAIDNVGHFTKRYVTTRFDVTPPGIDGTEVSFVKPDGTTVSGYCQDNIIDQHVDDDIRRSRNGANSSSGLKSVILYKVNEDTQEAIYSERTYRQFGIPDTHSFFDVYYDAGSEEICDSYILIATDFAGNRVTKKFTSQKALLEGFHTSIDRGSY